MYALSLHVKKPQNETIDLVIPVIDVTQNYFNVLLQVTTTPEGFLLVLPLGSLTTIIDLSHVNPYELWYFNDKQHFTGKAFALSTNNGSFMVQTQAKFVLVLHRERHSNLCNNTPVSFALTSNSLLL